METQLFVEISLVLVIATAVAGIMQLLRQPLIIGHIITGLLVGPSILNLFHSEETFELFSRIGIALLLFIVGLGLNPRVIREVGRVALSTGIGQIVLTSAAGFGIAKLLGFSAVASLYIGVTLCFSSTIIILKLLSDKKQLNRLPGKIATGFLLVQDIVAVMILIFVTAATQQPDTSLTQLGLEIVLKGGGLGLALGLISVHGLPRLSNFFARSQEFLSLFAIGWGLGIAALFAAFGFSVEIGALAAGISLALSPYSYEISSRMRPLRDFFIVNFFIVLGSSLSTDNLAPALVPALLLSLFVLIGNPIILMTIMGTLGYTRKTSFKVALTVAQISEFSLILILLAQQSGHVEPQVSAIMTIVGLLTIAVSTYMVIYDDKLYKWLSPILVVFERRKIRQEPQTTQKFDIVLFGYKGGSQNFIKTFKRLGKRFLVVDYDPETIDTLNSQGIPSRYGDANDSEFLDELNLGAAKLVIINLTDYAANTMITDHVRFQNKSTVIIAMTKSDKIENALELYEKGATYVMMPHFLSASKIATIIARRDLKSASFKQLRDKHTKFLLHQEA
jgi:Kef-type K+ transport system membrane component KefB